MKANRARFLSSTVLAGLAVVTLSRCAEERNPVLEPYSVPGAPTSSLATTRDAGATGAGGSSGTPSVADQSGTDAQPGASCSLLRQDCANTAADSGCYPESSSSKCYAAGGHSAGSACKHSIECQPGMACILPPGGGDRGKCEHLCDLTVTVNTLCTGKDCANIQGLPSGVGACQ